MRDQFVAFANVFSLRDDSKIPMHMQTTHEMALQRYDMIDFVSNASLFGQSFGLTVEGFDRFHIAPFWSSRQFLRQSRGHSGVDASGICSGPLAHVIGFLVFVLFTPLTSVVRAMIAILQVPRFKVMRVFEFPFTKVLFSRFSRRIGLVLRARSTTCFAARIELFAKFACSACIAESVRIGRLCQTLLSPKDLVMVVDSTFGFGHHGV